MTYNTEPVAEWIHPFAYSVIERDLATVKALSRTELQIERYSTLTSEPLLRPIWKFVTRRQKTDGGYTIPPDERPFLTPAIIEPPVESGDDPEMHEIIAQAHAVAQLLIRCFWIVENSNCDLVTEPKASLNREKLLLEAAEKIEVVAADLRDDVQIISLRAGEHHSETKIGLENAVSIGTANANGLNHMALQLRAAATYVNDSVNLALKYDPDALSLRINSVVELPGRSHRRRYTPGRGRSSHREAWVAMEISRAMLTLFGSPLEGLAASTASRLLGSAISREVPRSARRVRGGMPPTPQTQLFVKS